MRFQGKDSERSLTLFSRELRRVSTEAERGMWNALRDRRFFGIKFRRQFQIGAYIVDFYAPYLRLAVELDGEGHFNEIAAELDRERTQALEALGVTVVRFENCEVIERTFSPRLERVVLELRARTAFGWHPRVRKPR